MSDLGAAAARRVAESLRTRLGERTPAAGIILGSGLGGLAAELEDAITVPFAEIGGFPAATVEGHAGALLAGSLAGRRVLALAGRFHMYEGHDARVAGFPVRVLHALGARTLIVSNAAGGINTRFSPGDLMLIRDHINLQFRNPLIGALEPGDDRFPDMSSPYDESLARLAREAARDAGVVLREGVYAALLGPAYETPAEVRMLGILGADAVGMSTVPEVIVARAIGMRVLGVSCVTNLASGLTPGAVTHADVLAHSASAATNFQALIRSVVARLDVI